MESIAIVFLILIVLLAIFIIVFCGMFYFYLYRKKPFKEYAINYISSSIDLNKRSISLSKHIVDDETSEYKLDQFIYMLSKNPESKDFRELLKFINNNGEKELLKSKIKLLEKNVICTFTARNKTSFLIIKINKNSISGDFANFQILEIPIFNNDIDYGKENIFEDKLDNSEIFENILKKTESYNIKKLALLKFGYVSTDFSLEEKIIKFIQLSNFKKDIWNKYKIELFLCQNNSLYGITKNEKNLIKILKNEKSFHNILYGNLEKIDLFLYESNYRKRPDLEKGFIALELLSKNKSFFGKNIVDEKNKANFQKLNKKINEIYDRITTIIQEESKENTSIKLNILKVESEHIKSIVDAYVDLTVAQTNEIIKYSFLNKEKLIFTLISNVNDLFEKRKGKNQLSMFEIDIENLHYVTKPLLNISLCENFYIGLSNIENIKDKLTAEKSINKLYSDKKDINFIQIISSPSLDSLEFLKKIKPKYVLFTNKHISKQGVVKNWILRNTIEKNKKEKTELITLK